MQIRTYPHIVRFITQHPWAILPEKLHAIAELLSHRLVHLEPPGKAEVLASLPMKAAAAPSYGRAGTVAVMPMMGVIAKRMDMFGEISGGFSIERWQQSFRAAVADPDVETILLQIDSPGGSVYGVQEAADEIFKARSSKKIVAIADDLAASAAYWIGSAAEELIVTPSGEVGSIGVVAMHVDYSKALEQAGIAVTFIHSGDNKVEGNSYEPLSEDALKFQQSRVEDYYRVFTKAVAKGRGVSVADVNKNFGQGRVFGSEHAKQVGMVDRVATLQETLERLQSRRGRAASSTRAATAEADIAEAILKAS